MKLRLGDRVRFLNERLEGVVTSIKDHVLVGVTIGDDFEIPVAASELVKIDFEDAKSAPPAGPEIARKPNTPIGIFLAYDRKSETVLEAFLHNNISELLYFSMFEKEQDVYRLKKHGLLNRGEEFLLGRYDLEKLGTPLYQFHFLPLDQTSVKPQDPLVVPFRFNAKQFHQSFKFCFFLNRQAYLFSLDEKLLLSDLTVLKSKDFSERPEPVINW